MDTRYKHFSKPHREQQIIDAADYVLIQVGTHDFTIDRVVARLGVAKGTIYKYYKSKDDILAEVSVKALNILLDHFKAAADKEKNLLKALQALIMACYDFYLTHPHYFELIIYMERPDFNSDVRNYSVVSIALRNYFTEHLKKCQLAGLIRTDLDVTHCTYMIWGSCMGLMNFIEAKKVFIEDIEKLERKGLLLLYAETIIAGLKQ